MRERMWFWISILCAVFAAGCSGCEDRETRHQIRANQEYEVQVEVKSVISTEDLDLQAILNLFRDRNFADLDAIEKRINDPSAQLHNVDTDKDGNLDLISIVEVQTPNTNTKQFNLVARTKEGEDDFPIVTFNVNKTVTGEMEIEANYYSHVQGYDPNQGYYSHFDSGFMTGYLLGAWLWSPRVPYYHPYGYYYGGWGYRPMVVHQTNVYNQTRVTRTSTTSSVTRRAVSPTMRAQSTSNANVAAKVESRRQAATANARGRSGMTNFGNRSGSAPQRPATGFQRSSTPSRATPAPAPSPRKSGGWGGGSSGRSGGGSRRGK